MSYGMFRPLCFPRRCHQCVPGTAPRPPTIPLVRLAHRDIDGRLSAIPRLIPWNGHKISIVLRPLLRLRRCIKSRLTIPPSLLANSTVRRMRWIFVRGFTSMARFLESRFWRNRTLRDIVLRMGDSLDSHLSNMMEGTVQLELSKRRYPSPDNGADMVVAISVC